MRLHYGGAPGSVDAHSGEDHGEEVLAELSSRALERQVERRADTVDWRLAMEVDLCLARNHEMIVARCHEGDVCHESLTFKRLSDRKRALAVEPPSKRAGKGLRHVLDNDDCCLSEAGQVGKDRSQGGRTTGRRADDDKL